MAYEIRRTVFVCYAHEDREHLDLLRQHIKSARLGWEAWDDSRIQAGTDWREKIETALRQARAAILLVSAAFLSSEFIQEKELPVLLERARKDRFRLIPVQLRRTHGRHVLSARQFLNDPDNPVSEMSSIDKERIWARLAEELVGEDSAAGTDRDPVPASGEDDSTTEQPRMRPTARKLLKALVGFQREVRGSPLGEGTIGYKELFEKAGLPFIRRWAGAYLYEIHEWCRTNSWPPLNSLVVNAALGRPGGSYPGDNWEIEARECLEFRYPKEVLDPP